MSAPPRLPDEATLVDRAAKGDNGALGDLIEHYLPFANRVAFGYVRDSDVAQDIVADAFTSIIAVRERLDPERNFGGLVAKAVYHKTMSYFAKRTREARHSYTQRVHDEDDVTLELPDASKSIEDTVEDSTLRDVLSTALAKLSPIDQDIIYARLMNEETVAEVAQSLMISQAVVKVRLFRALRRLRKVLPK